MADIKTPDTKTTFCLNKWKNKTLKIKLNHASMKYDLRHHKIIMYQKKKEKNIYF